MSSAEATPWIETRREPGAIVVTVLVARLDPGLHKKGDYQRILAEAIGGDDALVVLDLSHFTYTNHVWGLFQLVFGAYYAASAAGGRLVVCGLRGLPKRVYSYAKIGNYVPEYRSKDQAINARGRNPTPCSTAQVAQRNAAAAERRM
jgi:hypothetical protein